MVASGPAAQGALKAITAAWTGLGRNLQVSFWGHWQGPPGMPGCIICMQHVAGCGSAKAAEGGIKPTPPRAASQQSM